MGERMNGEQSGKIYRKKTKTKKKWILPVELADAWSNKALPRVAIVIFDGNKKWRKTKS